MLAASPVRADAPSGPARDSSECQTCTLPGGRVMALKTRDTKSALAAGLRNVPPSTNMMARDTKAMLFVGCWPDGPVTPGKPFSISWQIWSINSGPGLGDVYAQIYLDGQLVHTTPSVIFVTQKWGGD